MPAGRNRPCRCSLLAYASMVACCMAVQRTHPIASATVCATHQPTGSVWLPGRIPRDKWALPTGADAEARARAVVEGLYDRCGAVEVKFQETAREVDPILSRAGARVWTVRFEKATRAAVPTTGAVGKEPWIRDIFVVLDPIHGDLLRAEIRDPARSPPIGATVRASVLSMTRQMAAAGNEVWGGVPTAPIKVNLVEALRQVERSGGDVRGAATVLVHAVTWGLGDQRRAAVWSIDLRGISPMPPVRADLPRWLQDHARHIVDALTGSWVMATSSPQPDAEPNPEAHTPDAFRDVPDDGENATPSGPPADGKGGHREHR